jgi:hypothetical protein
MDVKDSTLKLAFKHPTQTTIVQMQKDGTYRVVYGTKLDKITGSVKLSVVGYGFGIVSCYQLNACHCILLKCLRYCKLGSLLRQ